MIKCWIIGGGCYGSSYLRQFRKATARGRMPASRWIVLDRRADCQAAGERVPGDALEIRVGEWVDLVAAALREGEITEHDCVVPSPFQGPLISDWLQGEARSAGRTMAPVRLAEIGGGLRYEHAAGSPEVRYVSFADWTCPATCIEPPTCPATRGPKAWDLRDTIAEHARRSGFTGAWLFTCLHWVYGVGVTPAQTFIDARRHVREGPAGRFLLASLSTCHGALSGWELQ